MNNKEKAMILLVSTILVAVGDLLFLIFLGKLVILLIIALIAGVVGLVLMARKK